MEAENVQQQLIDAETKLSRALQRLHALRRAALYGNYDPVEFDRAVMAYRESESEVQQARESWAQMHQGASLVQAAAATGLSEGSVEDDAPSEPLQITPRLQFAKWLVETGRLTDWPQEVEAAA